MFIIHLGYRLFVKGIFTESGNMQASWDKKSLLVKKAAPGTFFVLFGSCIIAISIYKGLQFNNSSHSVPTNLGMTISEERPLLKDSLKIK